MVTFPAVIESGSDAKLCATLLNPQESLTMTVSLLDDKNGMTQLVKECSSKPPHRCFSFKAPRVHGESVQNLKVEVQGKVFRATEERKVMFKSYLPLTFIQTDKPIYNPGQMVNFRVVTMDAKFVPLDQMYNLVVVEDNNNNRIGQWTNVSSTGWILQLSHQLNSEAQIGMYTLKAFIGDREIYQVFEVKKYVLPKFDVTVNASQTYSVADVGLKVEACAKYTYGQPVPGQALVEVCRDPLPYVPAVTRQCLSKTGKMNATGCASIIVDTSEFFNTKFENGLQDLFVVTVNVTEEGTDVVMSKSATVSITFEVGKITVSRFNGTPVANKAVYLLDGNGNKLLLNLTTNQNGLATFSLNTAPIPKADLNLVFTTDTRAVRLLKPDSPNNPSLSELTIVMLEQPLKCGATFPVTVKYSFVGESGGCSADIVYMVLSRGMIVLHGFKNVRAKASNKVMSGSMSFKLSVGVDMAPAVQILVYCVLPSENVVVVSASFDTEACFQNKVSLQFSPATAVPAERNVLTVSAQAGSLCGLSAVDQSVWILEPGRRLSPKMVFDLLPVRSLSGYPYSVDEQECLGTLRPRQAARANHDFIVPPNRGPIVPTNKAYTTFKSLGMKVATNLAVRAPPCWRYPGFPMALERLEAVATTSTAPPAPSEAGSDGDKRSVKVTVRSYFPETWIWQLAQVGATGSTQVSLTVPDTITTWETEAFCLSSKGLGLAPPAQLTVFQPFFLELSLPYSIIRGETFELKATAFSYLSKCIMVKVTPASSTAFTLIASNEPYLSCLCANGRKTFKWVLTASVLGLVNVTVNASAEPSHTRCGTEAVTMPKRGRVDVVTRSLLVLGSAKCSVSVLGDIMGRALKNLDKLLRMPYGCGEQNMIVLAPNIYILLYLEVTGQLTAAIRETAIGYLRSVCKFQFVNSMARLTAFVLRTFGLARQFIFIDPHVLQSAKDWLISKQGSDSCFIQQGTLHHNDMKVSLQFSPATAVPAEDNVLTVSAQPGSLCGLSAVDQSVRIMESGRRLSAEMVFNLLPLRALSDYPYEVEDEQECLNVRSRRAVPADHSYETFKSVGLKIATNLPVREPQCLTYRSLNYYRNFRYVNFGQPLAAAKPGLPLRVQESAGGETSSFEVTVRTYFPETWIWQLAQVGDSGSTQVPLMVPDTITTWETEAFCLSSKGLGLAPPALLTVFQPFFLELSLPYSIVRGESFELKATVFNYLSKCIMVHVTPASSMDFTLKPYADPYSSCLCVNGRKTFKWVLSASVLGPVNVTVNASAEPSQTRCGTEAVTVPTRGRVDVVTRSLLVLPEGVERTNTQSWLLCPKGKVLSEDVTLTFPTNVVQGSARCSVSVLGDIMGRALKNLDRLLQMPYGCGEQNMIVLAPNIYILQYLEATGQLSAAIRETATGYLQDGYQGQLNYRHSDGSFSTFGYDASNTWLVVGNLGNAYATALLAYTFSLAGETSTRSQLLTSLNNLAISEGTKLHWSQTSSGDTLAVEISSYVLLAVLTEQPLTAANLGYANRIVNWLVTQQNPYGGFSSTQDTVVALHALSVYAAKVFSLDGSSTVTVQSPDAGGESYNFTVNRDNRLLFQEEPLNITSKYSVKASGSSCVSVQVACFYNIPTPVNVTKSLSVEAKVKADCQPLGANLILSFTVNYNGAKASTNMVIVDIKLLSGFTADASPLGSPPQSFAPLVERVDAGGDRVLVYLREVPKGVPMTYTLQLNQVLAVKNLKPAVINVYDYYQTCDAFETTYTSPCP
ncbi:Alpha-2-macroglobulin [Anabarilius grahami]|uniref:Alpha-2-macroglobulin n=1 Tax=Anabarilius grahami TaxID=495550 RepID=A0A3N0XCM8_ANAGA|nr:Alpha-2-macroglobulin [Anabarilius grahami]